MRSNILFVSLNVVTLLLLRRLCITEKGYISTQLDSANVDCCIAMNVQLMYPSCLISIICLSMCTLDFFFLGMCICSCVVQKLKGTQIRQRAITYNSLNILYIGYFYRFKEEHRVRASEEGERTKIVTEEN